MTATLDSVTLFWGLVFGVIMALIAILAIIEFIRGK